MKILYATPNSTDPLAFYRGSLPLSYLPIDYDIVKDVNWAVLRKYDLVFLQRPYTADHLELVTIAKKWGVPVVADFDDWLCDLPEANPAQHVFKANEENFKTMLPMFDGVITANDYLSGLVAEYNQNVVTVPNAYDARLFSYASTFKERRKIVLWRGGNSHLEDLMSVKDDHNRLAADFPDWQFVFIAQQPWWLDKRENISHIGGLGIMEYMRAIYDMCPAIMHHPLTDCKFNRAKSMCSWLEATHARAAFVGPDFAEFNRPGVTTYQQGELYNAIAGLITSPERIGASIDASTEYIHTHLTLKQVNKKRLEFFNAIIDNR